MNATARSADVIVLGAGAAGLTCAAVAAARGRTTLVLERNRAPGRKILVSGGGRCNFTNLDVRPEHFRSDNPHFCKSALARHGPRDVLDLVEAHGVDWREKHPGQIFCAHSSKAMLAVLLEECRRAGAVILTGTGIADAERRDEGFRVTAADGAFDCASLVVATGGLSWPKLGATDLGLRLARGFGLATTPVRPGLVPLVLGGSDGELCRDVSGVSFRAAVAADGARYVDDVLATHRGLSGPAVLQASNHWRRGAPLVIDLSPDSPASDLFAAHPTRPPARVLADALPRRFAEAWCARHAFTTTWADAAKPEQERLASTVHAWTVHPEKTEGYEKAEVTLGGVDTNEFSSQTFEAKSVPGLYFIGEILDVTGQLGGYNFQWAWSSGHAAGRHL